MQGFINYLADKIHHEISRKLYDANNEIVECTETAEKSFQWATDHWEDDPEKAYVAFWTGGHQNLDQAHLARCKRDDYARWYAALMNGEKAEAVLVYSTVGPHRFMYNMYYPKSFNGELPEEDSDYEPF